MELPRSLTEREREVLDMVCRGWATKEIAVALQRVVTHHRCAPGEYC